MDSERDLIDNCGQPFKSHLTGKFCTESESFKPEQYFAKYNKALQTFEANYKTFSFSKETKVNTSHMLADYPGSPPTFPFNPETSRKQSHCAWSEAYKLTSDDYLSINHDLKTVAKKEPLLYPKYSLHHFLHIHEGLRRVMSHQKDQIVLVFRIYKPYLSDSRLEDIKIQQEILVRGNQTFKHLENTIECTLDYMGLQDLSENPEEVKDLIKAEKMVYPFSFFYVNNTFYGSKGSRIISDVAKKFLMTNGFGPYQESDLDVPLQSVTFQIGRPYVYQHLGHCEHVFVLSDARLQGSIRKEHFPKVRVIADSFPKLCIMCAHLYARWLVVDCQKLPTSRSFLCHRCFRSYCYIDDRKVDSFKAFPYLDPAAIL